MALAADHRNLSPPAPEPGRWGPIIAAAWAEANASPPRPQFNLDTPFRASMSGSCARALGYYGLGVGPSDPMGLAGTWNTTLGTKIHSWWGDALVIAASLESKAVSLEVGFNFPGLVSGTTDAVIDDEAVELKTVGGFKFKMAVGNRGAESGPSPAHVTQLALAVKALGLARGTLVYLAKECLSDKELEKLLKRPATEDDAHAKFVAAWTYEADELVPIADVELRRLNRVLATYEQGRLPARVVPELPPGARVVDPATGRWEQRVTDEDTSEELVAASGTYWGCGYCAWQTRCADDAAAGDPVPIELTERKAS